MVGGVVSCLVVVCMSGCASDTTVVAQVARTPLVEPVAAPVPEPSDEEELPGLDANVVVDVVNQHQSAITGCHVIGYSGRGAHAGSVTLTWSIAPSGQVEGVSVADSSFDDASFHECIMAVIAGLEFPEAGGSTEVGGWRFRFRSSGNAAVTSAN